MKTQDFIAREFGNNDGRIKNCSSVVKDVDGNIYSYGSHYPLVFKVFGVTFINTAGYSTTTARHILWARRAVYDPIEIKLPRNFRLGNHKVAYGDNTPLALEYFKTVLVDQAVELQMQILKKKRKDTLIYKGMEHELNRLQDNIKRLQRLQSDT